MSELTEIIDGLYPTVAHDLVRDQRRLALDLARLNAAKIDNLCIVAPSRGGMLSGGLFMGYPIVEADTTRCFVGVGWWA